MDWFLNSSHNSVYFAGTHPKCSAKSTDVTFLNFDSQSDTQAPFVSSPQEVLTSYRFTQQFQLIWRRTLCTYTVFQSLGLSAGDKAHFTKC
jgi:hypothetical protein